MSKPDGKSAQDTETELDELVHASEARLTGGLSPVAAVQAWSDWAMNLANAPGKLSDAWTESVRRALLAQAEAEKDTLATLARKAGTDEVPDAKASAAHRETDSRFAGKAWQMWPFAQFVRNHHLAEAFWDDLTTGVGGVTKHHEDMVRFAARQLLDMVSPSNFPMTNPEVLARTVQTGGTNIIQGTKNLIDDWDRIRKGKPPVGVEKFRPGYEVAVTPGKVVFRNELIELIQYSPATETVYREPILFVPNWIMKYYILDLSPHNSMVRYLVEQGHTVFMISWLNPTGKERDFGMDTYVEKGALAAMEAVRKILPRRKINAVGYCIGGTLLSLTAAYLGATGKDWLSTVSLFAAQIDFTEAGEIMLFVDESQVDFLEDLMSEQGYLDGSQMGGAFQLLHSTDLIWSRTVHEYLMGDRPAMFDLMAWNADTTRMPARMHSEYLRRLFLQNDFAEGRYNVLGTPVAPRNIRPPVFQVGTERDHVAPWRSAYKVRLLTDTDVTFVLTNGGHNAGMISEPGHPHRRYRISTTPADAPYIAPEEWFDATPLKKGSWWPEWEGWLADRSGDRGPPPPMGNAKAGLAPLEDAPGLYILQR